MTIRGWRITRYSLPTPRPIGDLRLRIEALPLGSLELESDGGETGLGFFWSPSYPDPLPPLDRLERRFAAEWPALLGRSPFELLHRLERPRGVFGDAVDQALWDLAGKELGLPLYRLLGGVEPRVRAYASGLDYHLGDDEAQRFFADAAAQGFTAFKVKVGRQNLARDIERLRLVADAVGPEATLLVDANQAWSAEEAIARMHAYRDAGVDVSWLEDPCARDDVAAAARVRRGVPWAAVVLGEYLNPSEKRAAIEAGAVGVLNLHDNVGDGLRAAWLAAEHGIPVSVGNTAFDVGVHLAAALPDVLYVEWSFLGYDRLADEAIGVDGGYAVAPDRPGHGVSIAEDARAEYSLDARK
jgi:L-alanine-DL-glutamate epimerase-like enolase superfamily enzyme